MSSRIRIIEAGSGPTLTLRERGGVVEILAGKVVLLSSAALETERAFGRLAAATHAHGPRHVILGGLGFGATLRGVLEVAPADARVVVVEKVDAVVKLVQGELGHFAERPLDDKRVSLVNGDVADVIAGAHAHVDVDAILLDVDNGPHWASFRSNARLYTLAGLRSTLRALAPGGVLAVWSGYPADAFGARLRTAGFVPSIVPLRERGHVRARAYVGHRPRESQAPA